MKIDFGSLAWNCLYYSVDNKTGKQIKSGNASWSTAISKQSGDYTIRSDYDGLDEIMYGMINKSIPMWNLECKKGKGGKYVSMDENEEFLLASQFDNVIITACKDGVFEEYIIDKPFLMVITKECKETKVHCGAKILKYGESIRTNDQTISNELFFAEARMKMGISNEASWLIYEINIENQQTLRFKAIIVTPDVPCEPFLNSDDRKEKIYQLLPQADIIPDGDISYFGTKLKEIYDKADTKDCSYYVFILEYGKFIVDVYDPKDIVVAAGLKESFYKELNKAYNVYRYIKKNGINTTLLKSFMTSAKSKSSDELYQTIFFGTPGGGKSHKVNKIVENKDERVFRTTFHPDTDYSTFVGSYKPVMDGDEIRYEFRPQAFVDAYTAAWNDPDNAYYLVIEEINRGNCAQIFGDLFQLLDRKDGVSEYRIKADADLRNYLEGKVKDQNGQEVEVLVGVGKEGIANGELCLPSNLNILATMNTSDQSLFPMDSAFKRRWDWEYVPSSINPVDNFDLKFDETHIYKWHTFREKINEKILERTSSEDKQLGSYFIKHNLNAAQFKSKVMYYLWSEIYKDEYGTPNNDFKKDKTDNKGFSFNELYTFGPDNSQLLIAFMDALEVPNVVNIQTPQSDDIQEGDSQRELPDDNSL